MVGITFVTIALFISPENAYGPIYMKYGDIKGDVTESSHKEWIDILSIQLDSQNQGSESIQSLSLIKYADRSTPKIIESLATGEHFTEFVLESCNQNLCPDSIILRNVVITSYTVDSSNSTSDRPKETISLSFEKIEYGKPQEPSISEPTSTQRVPEWIKNNAGWWAEKQIEDTDFLQGIQFMIKEKIITIPNLPESGAGEKGEVPEWVKNNAGWWSKGLISEDDFVNGIKYLVEKGIIRVR